MSALGTVALGTEAIAGQLLRVPPVVSILSVTPFPTTVGTVTWTYSSPAGRPQVSARIRVYAPTDLTVLFDSGVVAGADTAFNIPLTVQASSSYFVAVSGYDGFDWSEESKVFAQSGSDDILNYPPVGSVGRVYEIAINGQGYMLSDGIEDLQYKRVLQNLQPTRFATSATPFSENVDHYSFVRFNDFSGGAGQLYRDRKSSIDTAFFDSEGVDPWTPGKATLLHDMASSTPPIAAGRAAVYSNNLIMRRAGNTGLLTFSDPTNPVLYHNDFRAGLGEFVAYDDVDRVKTNASVHYYDPRQVTTDASGMHITAALKELTYDDFTAGTISTHLWGIGGAPTVSAGQLHITPTASYPSLRSRGQFVVKDGIFAVEVPQITSGGANTRQAIFDVANTNGSANALRFLTVNGNIGWGTRTNGVDTLTTVAYNSTNHRFWRIRESGGTVHFEVAPTPGTVWTELGTVPTPTTYTVAKVVLQSGFFGAETAPNDTIFDNVKITTWYSGLVDTSTTLTFAGNTQIDVRMWVDNYGKGGWPSWWRLQPGKPWPTGGEKDGMEYQGDGLVYGTIHGDNPLGSGVHWAQGGHTAVDITVPHVYSLREDATSFTWFLDGVAYFTCNKGPNAPAPFDQPFDLIMNFAVGGSWPGNPDGTTPTTMTMNVDYITVTDLNSTGTSGSTNSFAVGSYTITDLCSDGAYWYACDPAHGTRKNNTAADPGSDWSTLPARVIEYAGGRICAALDATGNARRFSTLGPAGTEEVAGGRLDVPVGWQIVGFTGGSGFVWFGAKSADRGTVYAWQAGSTDTPFVALDLPNGQWVESVYYYLGNVFVRAGVNRSTSGKTGAVIYRCVADSSGTLTPFRVTDIGVTGPEGDYAAGNFSASDKYVFFTWGNMSSTGLAGVGCVNLETGGYCKWVYGQAMASPRTVVWRNRVVLTDATALSIEDDDTFLTAGWLLTSASDLDASLDKVLDSVTLSLSSNDGTQAVDLEVSYDGDRSTVDPGIGRLGFGTLSAELPWGRRTKSFGLKFLLTRVSGGTAFLGATVRLHPLGIADELVQLPINCADDISDLRGTRIPGDSGPGRGALRARALMGLAESRVLFQDVDYAITKVAAPYDVVDAEIRSLGAAYNSNLGMQQRNYVVVLTLRRRSK
jgi:hypothetical protein